MQQFTSPQVQCVFFTIQQHSIALQKHLSLEQKHRQKMRCNATPKNGEEKVVRDGSRKEEKKQRGAEAHLCVSL